MGWNGEESSERANVNWGRDQWRGTEGKAPMVRACRKLDLLTEGRAETNLRPGRFTSSALSSDSICLWMSCMVGKLALMMHQAIFNVYCNVFLSDAEQVSIPDCNAVSEDCVLRPQRRSSVMFTPRNWKLETCSTSVPLMWMGVRVMMVEYLKLMKSKELRIFLRGW